MELCDRMKIVMHRHGIHNTTIQPEFVSEAAFEASEDGVDHCHEIVCPSKDCAESFCCTPTSRKPSLDNIRVDDHRSNEDRTAVIEPPQLLDLEDVPEDKA